MTHKGVAANQEFHLWPQSRSQLFRATYTRNHTQCGMTFAKRNDALAQLFFVEVLLGYISSIGGREAHVIPIQRREAAVRNLGQSCLQR